MASRRNLLATLFGGGIIGGAAIYALGRPESSNPVPNETPPTPTADETLPFSPQEVWTQFQASAKHDGISSTEQLHSESPERQWQRRFSSPSRSGLVATQNCLIEQRRDYLQALDKITGEVVWDAADTGVDEFSFLCDPVVHDESVIFAGRNSRTLDREVISLGASTGEIEWKKTLSSDDGGINGLTVDKNRICVLRKNYDTEEILITTLSTETQEIDWTHEVTAYDAVNRPVAISQDAIVFGGRQEYERTGTAPSESDSPGGVTALNPETGTVMWRKEVAGTQLPVTIYDNIVIVTPNFSFDTYAEIQQDGPYPLMGLQVATGEIIWQFEAQDIGASSPAVTPEHVYYGLSETLWAIDTTDGSLGWQTDVGRFVEASSPAVVGNLVLIGDLDFNHEESYVTAFNRMTGEKQWERAFDESQIRAVMSVDGAVFAKGETYHDEESETIRAFW